MEENEIIELFCLIDDFTKRFNTLCSLKQIEYKKRKIRNRKSRTSLAEVMTMLILFHRSNYRCFKHFFLHEVSKNLKYLFPNLVGYSQFVRLMQEAFFPMFCFTQEHLGVCSGISFIDSTVLTSCHVKRASSHKTFKKQAKWGKTTTGWFFGFKLHLVINHQSEIIAFRITGANVDDRKPVPDMMKDKKGRAFADKGYISKRLNIKLLRAGVHLMTKVKKNMKNQLMSLHDKCLLRKRAIIESVNNLLKNHHQIEHHRHRSPWNFLSNLLSGIAAYCLNPNKPRLFFSKKEMDQVGLLTHV
ncbi:MAG: IS982 family transposase [Halobacteriovoraceae bacterium]|nr:IS982 family transposase [Halobacteriovoraceae bacterium]